MELMIVVVIVGVLMMVALPAYQDSLQKGRRADGMAALMDAAGRQEKFMLDRSTYTIDMMDLGYGTIILTSLLSSAAVLRPQPVTLSQIITGSPRNRPLLWRRRIKNRPLALLAEGVDLPAGGFDTHFDLFRCEHVNFSLRIAHGNPVGIGQGIQVAFGTLTKFGIFLALG